MRVRRTRSGPSTERTRSPGRRGSIGRRLSAAGARCDRTVRHGARWISRRRRLAAEQFLRGAYYAAGTALAGLLVVLAQSR
ncbi:hypothetical protein FNX48_005585 [Streptomyces sp. IF17]|nr:hypothetical protein [Streptomyces alkaliphilus]